MNTIFNLDTFMRYTPSRIHRASCFDFSLIEWVGDILFFVVKLNNTNNF